MDFSRLTVPQRISAISIAVVAVGAFLPWVSIFGLSKSGVEGDGVVTLVAALVGAGVMLATTGLLRDGRVPGKAARIVPLVLASFVAVIAIADMNGAAAIGLYLTLFAGIAWVVGAVWDLSTPTKPDAEQSMTPGEQL